MITDPLLLLHIVRANAELAMALDTMPCDACYYEDVHARLVDASKRLEVTITRLVMGAAENTDTSECCLAGTSE